MHRLVHHFLEESAARWPDKVALICGDERYTYGELETQANRLANALVAQGVERGDRVALLLGNTVEAVLALFAVLKLGAVYLPIAETTKASRVRRILQSARPAAVIVRTMQGSSPITGAVIGETPSVRLVVCVESAIPDRSMLGRASSLPWAEIQASYPATRPQRAVIDLDLACLIYTSGSTGEPKGVMCDHAAMVFATHSITDYLHNTSDDVILSVLSLVHSYGLYQLLATFSTGATLVLERSFGFATLMLQKMQTSRATGFAGTPTIYALLLQFDLSQFDFSALRYLSNAAAGLPIEHLRRIRAQVPWVQFYCMHGLTEVVRTLYLPPELAHAKRGSVGIPMPGTEAWLIDEAGERVGPGVTGELVIRGRHVMRGYWEDPEATALRFRPGRTPGERVCFTGDLFRQDTDGHFHFVARKDDIIKCRGEKVAPREVENVLCSLEGVVEAAAVGVPDLVHGQAIKAVLVVNGEPVNREAVLRHCRQHLEDFMIPQQIEFRKELPRTESGKILRPQLSQGDA